MDVLTAIMTERGADAAREKVLMSEGELRRLAAHRSHHNLADRLQDRSRTCIIAEMKKASPSAGMLRDTYEPARIAAAYEKAGACGLSVLTEPRHFLGSGQHLQEARGACSLPILRKDFISDPWQILEAAGWGADVVLLIVAGLDRGLMGDLYGEARQLGLDVLIESHTEEEIQAALELPEAIIGVNSRDLKTLKTDLAVSRRLARIIPPERLSVAESGIRTRAEIEELRGLGYRGFLIGEVLMAAPDPSAKLAGLVGG